MDSELNLDVDAPEKVARVLNAAANASAVELTPAWQDQRVPMIWAAIAGELDLAAWKIEKIVKQWLDPAAIPTPEEIASSPSSAAAGGSRGVGASHSDGQPAALSPPDLRVWRAETSEISAPTRSPKSTTHPARLRARRGFLRSLGGVGLFPRCRRLQHLTYFRNFPCCRRKPARPARTIRAALLTPADGAGRPKQTHPRAPARSRC